jgi:predicted hydrocarbon binding protein
MSQPQPVPDALLLPVSVRRILLNAYEEVLGDPGVIALKKLSGADLLFDGGAQPGEVKLDELGKVHETLELMFGPRAGRGLALRAGRAFFKYSLRELGPSSTITELNFRTLPLSHKIEKGSYLLLDLFNGYAGKTFDLEVSTEVLRLHIEHCPLCWHRSTHEPCCHLAVGVFQEALYWISGGKHYCVEETACIAVGDPQCVVEIAREPLD